MAEYSFKQDPRISDWQRDLLRDFCSSLEGDIVQLANSFGLKVYLEDLLPDHRGYLERAPSLGSASGWVIKLNQRDAVERQNFTTAHELGHFVLHKARLDGLDQFDGRMHRNTGLKDDPFVYLEEKDRQLEAEANRFAALLLMPPNQFKPAFYRLDGRVNELAKLFLVTEPSVEVRIRELGLK